MIPICAINANMAGQIPSSLDNLAQLTFLGLERNSLTGMSGYYNYINMIFSVKCLSV